jgi:tetratricopeptide (TPR) repeat protein
MDVQRFFFEAHRQYFEGHLDLAEQLLKAILTIHPSHAGALHGLGVLWLEAGRAEEALEPLGKAALIEPGSARYHGDLGAALQSCGRREEAIPEYHQALFLDRDYVGALSNLGGNLRELGQLQDALRPLERAVKLDPSHLGADMNLGLTLLDLEKYAEAKPYLERWVALDPDNYKAHHTLGSWHERQGLLHDAAKHYWRSLQLKPDCFQAANNLGVCLTDGGYRADAMTLYRKAIELMPGDPDVWSNLGVVSFSMGDPTTGLECHDRALTLDPNSVKARWNRSMCLLALGRLKEGWADHDCRWEAHPKTRPRPFHQPVWDGSDLSGKTILVWMEQGLGDQILAANMIPDLLRPDVRCILECEHRLVKLFERSFPGATVASATNPPFTATVQPDIDFQIAGGSLPRWLRPTIESFPKRHGYLVPDPALVGSWKERLAKLGDGPKVGVCWRSSMNRESRSLHYAQLSQWGPILAIPGIRFVNLQYDECAGELREAQRLFGTTIHVWDGMDLKNDQDGVAALMCALDLVVSAHTAVSELAGAMGMPTWVLARDMSNWNCLGQNYNPWLPSSRIFWCGTNDPWEPVIENIAAELPKALLGISPVHGAIPESVST